MGRAKIKFSILAVLLFVCIGSTGKATYLTGKAWLAQILLNHAWSQSLEKGELHKPWPWADVEPIAKLQIPRLKQEQIVLTGHSGEAMAFGPGLIQRDTSYILAGHRDSHFAFLENLQLGDVIALSLTNSENVMAQITSIEIFDSDNYPELLAPANSILLVTCYPFNAIQAGGSLRYLVVASF